MKLTAFFALLLLVLCPPVMAGSETEFFQPYAAVSPQKSSSDAENYVQQEFQMRPEALALLSAGKEGEFFLILPIVDGLYARLFELSVDKQGQLYRKPRPVATARLGEGRNHQALLMHIPISEGAPSYELCLQNEENGEEYCWQPGYSGKTDELKLDQGFILLGDSEQ